MCDRTCVMYAGAIVEQQSSAVPRTPARSTRTPRRCSRHDPGWTAGPARWRRSQDGHGRRSRSPRGVRVRRPLSVCANRSASRAEQVLRDVEAGLVRCRRAEDVHADLRAISMEAGCTLAEVCARGRTAAQGVPSAGPVAGAGRDRRRRRLSASRSPRASRWRSSASPAQARRRSRACSSASRRPTAGRISLAGRRPEQPRAARPRSGAGGAGRPRWSSRIPTARSIPGRRRPRASTRCCAALPIRPGEPGSARGGAAPSRSAWTVGS